MFGAYRCEICGEVYLGSEKPEECPFCGAHQNFVKALGKEDYSRVKVIEPKITEESLKDIKEAIELEVENYLFYDCAASKTEEKDKAETFERLSKVEMEHAKALADLGRLNRDIIEKKKNELAQPDCSEDYVKNFQKSHEVEDRAIKEYSKFAKKAPETQIKKFFAALVSIERDHLRLSKQNT